MYGSPLERRSTCNQNHFRNRCGSLIFLDKLYPAICVYLILYHGRPHNVHCFLWLAILLVLHVIWTIPPSCERSSIELSCISSKISFTSPSYCMAILLHALRIGGYVRAMSNFSPLDNMNTPHFANRVKAHYCSIDWNVGQKDSEKLKWQPVHA